MVLSLLSKRTRPSLSEARLQVSMPRTPSREVASDDLRPVGKAHCPTCGYPFEADKRYLGEDLRWSCRCDLLKVEIWEREE